MKPELIAILLAPSFIKHIIIARNAAKVIGAIRRVVWIGNAKATMDNKAIHDVV